MALFSLIHKVCGEEILPFPSADLLLLVITLSLSVGPVHADMALNSQSTEGVRPGRTDYVFQGILAYKESPGVFPGSIYSWGNSDFLKLACPDKTLVLMMLLPGKKFPRFQTKFPI